MVLVINNKGKFIIISAGKVSYMLCKRINGTYDMIKNGEEYDPATYKLKRPPYDTYDISIEYNIYLHIRNPFTRIVSIFYAVSNYPPLSHYNSLYTNFSQFIDILYHEHTSGKHYMLLHPVIGRQVDQYGHIFMRKYNIKPTMVFETSELNNFISHINEEYNLNIPVGKVHSFNYKNDIKDAIYMPIKDIYEYRPPFTSFINDETRDKIREIYADDFILCHEYGYDF